MTYGIYMKYLYSKLYFVSKIMSQKLYRSTLDTCKIEDFQSKKIRRNTSWVSQKYWYKEVFLKQWRKSVDILSTYKCNTVPCKPLRHCHTLIEVFRSQAEIVCRPQLSRTNWRYILIFIRIFSVQHTGVFEMIQVICLNLKRQSKLPLEPLPHVFRK